MSLTTFRLAYREHRREGKGIASSFFSAAKPLADGKLVRRMEARYRLESILRYCERRSWSSDLFPEERIRRALNDPVFVSVLKNELPFLAWYERNVFFHVNSFTDAGKGWLIRPLTEEKVDLIATAYHLGSENDRHRILQLLKVLGETVSEGEWAFLLPLLIEEVRTRNWTLLEAYARRGGPQWIVDALYAIEDQNEQPFYGGPSMYRGEHFAKALVDAAEDPGIISRVVARCVEAYRAEAEKMDNRELASAFRFFMLEKVYCNHSEAKEIAKEIFSLYPRGHPESPPFDKFQLLETAPPKADLEWWVKEVLSVPLEGRYTQEKLVQLLSAWGKNVF